MLEIEGEHPDKLLHRDVTEKIIGAAFEVHGEKRVQVRYKEVVVGDYDSDLIVDGSVLVELKVNPQYDRRDEAQLLNVLKATSLKVGLLVNFGRIKVEFKRLVF